MRFNVINKILGNNCGRYVVLFAISLAAGCVSSQHPYAVSSSFSERDVGVGYAVINAQPGNSPEEKRLMAIKASKLEAYKSLAEQIYGQYLESRGTLSNLKLSDEEITSRVEGLVVGARVVSIKPISTDSYETVLEVGHAESIDYLATANDSEGKWSTKQGSE